MCPSRCSLDLLGCGPAYITMLCICGILSVSHTTLCIHAYTVRTYVPTGEWRETVSCASGSAGMVD